MVYSVFVPYTSARVCLIRLTSYYNCPSAKATMQKAVDLRAFNPPVLTLRSCDITINAPIKTRECPLYGSAYHGRSSQNDDASNITGKQDHAYEQERIYQRESP